MEKAHIFTCLHVCVSPVGVDEAAQLAMIKQLWSSEFIDAIITFDGIELHPFTWLLAAYLMCDSCQCQRITHTHDTHTHICSKFFSPKDRALCENAWLIAHFGCCSLETRERGSYVIISLADGNAFVVIHRFANANHCDYSFTYFSSPSALITSALDSMSSKKYLISLLELHRIGDWHISSGSDGWLRCIWYNIVGAAWPWYGTIWSEIRSTDFIQRTVGHCAASIGWPRTWRN